MELWCDDVRTGSGSDRVKSRVQWYSSHETRIQRGSHIQKAIDYVELGQGDVFPNLDNID